MLLRHLLLLRILVEVMRAYLYSLSCHNGARVFRRMVVEGLYIHIDIVVEGALQAVCRVYLLLGLAGGCLFALHQSGTCILDKVVEDCQTLNIGCDIPPSRVRVLDSVMHDDLLLSVLQDLQLRLIVEAALRWE